MIKKFKTILVIFTAKQLRKLLTHLYKDGKPKDKEMQEIITHLQGILHDYTGTWIV